MPDRHEAARSGAPVAAVPRVLVCIPTLDNGGAERQFRLLAGRLVARGVDLSLFSRLSEAHLDAMTKAGVRCFPVAAPGNYNPLIALELSRAARAARADVIHTFLPQMDIAGGLVALLSRRTWLLSERSSPEAYQGGGKSRLRAWLGRRASAIVANSPSGLGVWPDHPARHIIPNGVDVAAIADAPSEPASDGAMLEGRTVIVSIARLSPEKRLDRLIAAAALLKREVPNLLVLFIGVGTERAALSALAGRLGVADHVRFLGYRDDVWSWLKRASVLVSPSRFEGQPNAVLEAAAAAVPQVLSDIRMHRDALGDDGAVFVQPDDERRLAAAILELIRDEALRRRVTIAARRRVEAQSIDHVADRLAGLYRELAGQRPAGS